MRFRIPLLLGAFILAAAALAGLFMLTRGGPAGDPATGTSVRTAASAPALQWRVGTSQRYAVAVDSSFLLTMPGSSAGQSMNLKISAVLDYRTLAVTAAGITSGMRFSSIDMVMDGARDAGVNRALATPFRVRFEGNGRPLAFEFPATLAAGHRDVLENLIRMFQVVVSKGDSWQAQESNASGRYEAVYVSSASSTLVKRKQRYFDTGSASAVPEVVSTESIRIEPGQDWITGMTVDETLVISDPGGVPVRVRNQASMQYQPGPAQVAVAAWRFPAAPAADTTGGPEAEAVAPLTLAEAERRLVDDLAALDTAVEGRSLLINRVRDLLLANDQLPQSLLERMRTRDLTDRTRADLYLAFELAGTPAAQAALASVLADTGWSTQDTLRAVVALGGVADPTGDTLAALWALAHTGLAETERADLPGTAALAIGSLGNTLRNSEDAHYLALRSDLLGSASGAATARERAVFLYALGNTADPDPALRRDIASYLDDPSPRVRSAAARALGKLGTDIVAKEIMHSVTRETNPQARASMVEALASWDAPTAAAIEWARAAIRTETDEDTRYNMAVLLGNNMTAFPENRTLLLTLLETEQSRRIRQQMAEMLY